jgi:hypothetical protein
MGKVYHVDGYLDPMVGVLRETLLYCDGSLRTEDAEGNAGDFWFKVETEGGEPPAITAKGAMRGVGFTFRSGADGSFFSVKGGGKKGDAEDSFHEFAMRLHFFRKSKRLAPLDLDRFYDIDREGVPAVTADNYALLSGADTGGFLGLLGGKTAGLNIRNTGGKYSVIRYSENARITKFLCQKNIPVYRAFLEDFARFYGFKDAVFVFCRRGKEQHVFFYVKGTGLYHNTRDGSGEFMEEEGAYMEMLLEATPDYLVEGKEWWEEGEAPVYEYRSDSRGKTYTLYFNGLPTELRINAATMMGQNSLQIIASLAEKEEPASVTPNAVTYTGMGVPPMPDIGALFPGAGLPPPSEPKMAGPPSARGPVIWLAEGGGDGKSVRPYLTLKTAMKKELEYADKIFKSGEIATVVGNKI